MKRKLFCLLILLFSMLFLTGFAGRISAREHGTSQGPVRRVNTPYDVDFSERAIFWFGEVGRTSNYADVRAGYDDENLIINVHIFDRQLWYDNSPAPGDLEDWDAVTLYLDVAGNHGTLPTSHSYQFVAQLNPPWQARDNYQVAYQGNGSGWVSVPNSFSTEVHWRGGGFNNEDESRGWRIRFVVPFDSVGASPLPTGEVWGLGLSLHDRDDTAGTPIPEQMWPEWLDGQNPSSWGQLHFGLPNYNPPLIVAEGSVLIRQGLNNAEVKDGHVGGHSTCGNGLDYWTEWGEANYAGYTQISVQNQRDLADWPCFSKYYVTFPLDAVPSQKIIRSATLTMFHFGNAGQQWNPPPEPSLIQVLVAKEDWNESSLNWNNAPLAAENVAATWVEPLNSTADWPGMPIEWDVTRAVAEAYAAGEPLHLILYSADGPIHSGKYFYSSDAGEEGRPRLEITWGRQLEVEDRLHLPLLIQ